MDTGISKEELEVFLPEYKEIICKFDGLVAFLASGEAIRADVEFDDIYMCINNLVGMSDYTYCKDFIELSACLLQFSSQLCSGLLVWNEQYIPVFIDCKNALFRIYDKFDKSEVASINESYVIKEIRNVLRVDEVSSSKTDDMDPEEKEIFLQELTDYIEIFSNSYDKLIEGKEDKEIIFNCFKSAHTLKGFAALIEFRSLKNLSEELEKMFLALKEKKISWSSDMLDIMSESRDLLSSMLDDVLERRNGEYMLEGILKKIRQAYISDSVDSDDDSIIVQPAKSLAEGPIELTEKLREKVHDLLKNGGNLYDISIIFDEQTEMKSVRCFQFICILREKGAIIETSPSEDDIMNLSKVDDGVRFLYHSDNLNESDIKMLIDEVSDLRSITVLKREV
ncbi:MAG TPA: hypothetical protein DCS13_05705 [Candidatus Margulisbacteria bacterium]|nr:MAG: hypothetical protein A2X43_01770 [Candidatus Margulisbacteria bacterium GWD2_39_127]HAR62944.1 hypothetical protein [Candidatus Margulisiibacteriota bacterium]HCY37019.1 hypothetical protein [Candidatus Margulisiibacteriota bacterium]